jgi:threonine 3-dehydrogenase
VQEGGLLPGETAAVFGVGVLGLFSIQIARVAGASEIIAVGLLADANRFEVARKLGATRRIPADRENMRDLVREIIGGEGVSLVIDAAGPSAVLAQSFSILRSSGKIIKINYDPGAPDFSLKGHFGYDWVSWRNCIRLRARGALRMAALITHTMGLSTWEE